MNFIDYCIVTKNYSTLNAIDEYTKSFATNPGIVDQGIRDQLAIDLNKSRRSGNKDKSVKIHKWSALHKQMDLDDSKLLGRLLNKSNKHKLAQMDWEHRAGILKDE